MEEDLLVQAGRVAQEQQRPEGVAFDDQHNISLVGYGRDLDRDSREADLPVFAVFGLKRGGKTALVTVGETGGRQRIAARAGHQAVADEANGEGKLVAGKIREDFLVIHAAVHGVDAHGAVAGAEEINGLKQMAVGAFEFLADIGVQIGIDRNSQRGSRVKNSGFADTVTPIISGFAAAVPDITEAFHLAGIWFGDVGMVDNDRSERADFRPEGDGMAEQDIGVIGVGEGLEIAGKPFLGLFKVDRLLQGAADRGQLNGLGGKDAEDQVTEEFSFGDGDVFGQRICKKQNRAFQGVRQRVIIRHGPPLSHVVYAVVDKLIIQQQDKLWTINMPENRE